MSYLTRPTITFRGDFQADVATENNHPSFVSNPPGTNPAGGLNWNPIGSGAFRLLDCEVAPAAPDDPAPEDPIHGARVRPARDRVSAKIVDLDPQYQSASELYGLRVEVVAGGVVLLGGEFDPAGFRDLWGLQARYQSVLGELTWAPEGVSGAIDRLRAATAGGLLSIRMTTHGFDFDAASDRFTLGWVEGAIGPHLLGEPRRFVPGRRFVPAGPRDAWRVNAFDARLDPSGTRLAADLSNALPLRGGRPAGVGQIQLGLLDAPGTPEGASLAGGGVHLLGEPIPYTVEGWLSRTGGLVSVDVPPEVREVITERPLTLVRLDPAARVLVRETADGWSARADHETRRAEAVDTVVSRVHVTRYGVASEGTRLDAVLGSPTPGAVPPTATPADAVTIHPPDPTGPDGTTGLRIDCDYRARTRDPIDGQIYQARFTVPGTGAGDVLTVLVFDHYEVPLHPTWEGHVRAILTPYAQLYPVMTERLLDMRVYEQVRAHRQILQLALSLDTRDPNSMPVTRDLSAAKRATLLAWLASPDLTVGTADPGGPRQDPVPGPDADDEVLLAEVGAALVGKERADRERARVIAEGTQS